MVEFPYENVDDPLTTGRGNFLDEEISQYSIGDTLLCSGFKVDSPPHDSIYFRNQISAVINYYNSVSNGNIDLNYSVLKTTFEVSLPMRDYATNDEMLADFFNESITLAKDDIVETGLDLDHILLVIFHAGMGQDFSVPFIDPTSHDLKSAYVDDEMFDGNYIEISGKKITRGLILPETQNMLYYDVAQDIFPETYDLCDIQVGLTGTFALLMGYALELPPLFNTESGMAGVGVFGLMDHGSNNGRGVIPAPPTAWTRINQGWADSTIIEQSGTYTINSRDEREEIYGIKISSNEYFLIENRNNWIFENADIDSLRRKEEYKISDDQIGHWFDTVLGELSVTQFDTVGGVFTKFDNYDYGLPGSGLLIWHIREPEEELSSGINNDPNNQAIQLEEADGAVDIGYTSSHPLFTQHVNGWEFDLWYADNFYYFEYGNAEETEVVFDKDTRPNTDASDGAQSGIRIKILSEPSEEMLFSVEFGVDLEYEVESLSDNEIIILGNGQIDGVGNIFYARDDKIYKNNSDDGEIEFSNLETYNRVLCNEDICEPIIEDSQIGITYFDPNGELSEALDYFVLGYLTSINETETLPQKASLGDIDGDGLDELVSISDSSIVIENYPNYIDLNGFPVNGDFHGQPLIADIINVEEDHPEIICREGNHITILSHKGERIREIAAFSDEQIAIIPNWRDNKAALIDGPQILIFDFDSADSYWLNEFSQSSNYPESTGNHEIQTFFGISSGLKAYNYPNPVEGEYTIFRFFVDDANSVSINIYDILGLHVDSLEKTTPLIQNEFNEITWNLSSGIKAGLYFAEILLDSGDSQLVKVVVIR
jgi:M6 family metalloprotease-like protein